MNPLRHRRVVAVLGLLMTMSLLTVATPSVAGPPGDNGPIVMATSDGLYTVGSDGSNQQLIVPGSYTAPDVSPDGRQVLAKQGADLEGPIVKVDMTSGAITEVGVNGTSAVWSGDGTAIAVANLDAGLLVIEGSGAPVARRAGVTAVFDWSPTDNRVLVSRSVDSGFYPDVYLETFDVESEETVELGNNGPGLYLWYPTGGDFSPDGNRIVYSYNELSYTAVVYAGDEANPIAETQPSPTGDRPTGPITWSPDGISLAYGHEDVGGFTVVVHTVATRAETSFAANGDLDWAPVPSEAIVFDDVSADNIYYDDIVWLAEQGITKGCNPPDNTLFCPDDNVTRGQMAAFLVRAFSYTDGAGSDQFTDDDANVFENDIDLLATAGVTKGCNPPDNTLFCPDDNVTRGQMAAFLVRAFSYTDGAGSDQFTDDDANVFENDIDLLATAGVTLGCNPPDNTLFCPDDNVTRGQMAAFLHRAITS